MIADRDRGMINMDFDSFNRRRDSHDIQPTFVFRAHRLICIRRSYLWMGHNEYLVTAREKLVPVGECDLYSKQKIKYTEKRQQRQTHVEEERRELWRVHSAVWRMFLYKYLHFKHFRCFFFSYSSSRTRDTQRDDENTNQSASLLTFDSATEIRKREWKKKMNEPRRLPGSHLC